MNNSTLDHRLYAYRDDLADQRLAGKITHRGRLVSGRRARVQLPVVNQYAHPDTQGGVINQLLMGEAVDIFTDETAPTSAWAWVQSARDDYVGYVQSHAVTTDFSPTHFVHTPSGLLLNAPAVKAETRHIYPMLAEVQVEALQGQFCQTPHGFIPQQHLLPIDQWPANALPDQALPDILRLGESFLGAPYIWGGKSRLGLDCSGLVQILFRRFGCPLPRDTDMQCNSPLLSTVSGAVQAGDLVFWTGHVGIMLDSSRLLHANAFAMHTTIEPLAEVTARILATESHAHQIKRWRAS